MRFRIRLALMIAFVGSSAARSADLVPPPGAAAAGRPVLIAKKDAPEQDRPFWRRKAELTRKMRDERAVLVSVKREDIAGDQIRFTMAGAGIVSRSKDFCFRVAQQYEKLKEVSDHFKTVTFDRSARQLFIVTEALGYQARMIMRVSPVSEDWRNELQWEVIWGHFKGMTGLIGFEKTDGDHTEISLNARYEAAELPLPRILMGFALEVITQKVAEKMRAFIEAQPANAAEAKPQAESEGLQVKNDPMALPGLGSIRLPPGFSISVFAHDVPGARQMTLSPSGTLFIGSRDEGKVYAIPEAAAALAKNERAPAAQTIASGLNEPNGVAFHKGSLYVAEISRVVRFDEIEKKLSSPPKPAVVRADYPKIGHHGWKYIAIGPDGWLYIPVGAPCNVCKRDEQIFSSITRMSLDGKKREIFAEGVRNTVGFDWHPVTRELWFTDNGRDMMGDNIPGDELNRATKAGLHFGFPFCHQGNVKDPEFGKTAVCSGEGPYRLPAQVLGPHVAALGMKFYTAKQFPESYRGRVFIAEHGSWNRSNKIGYRVMTVRLDDQGRSLGYEVFAEGWLQGENPWGRPVDILIAPDGSMLVSDDHAGVVYRIRYSAQAAR